MKVLRELERLLESELKDVVQKGDISATELENAYKAVDIIKDIATIRAMEDASFEDEGYSERRGVYRNPGYYDDPSYYVGNYSNGSYRNDGRYMSGRGQYRTDSGYSRHYQEKESAMDKLEDMLRTASSDQEKAVIKKMMDKLYD